MTKTLSPMGARARSTTLRNRTSIALGLSVSLLAGCSADKLNITNPNVPSVASAGGDPQAVQLQATGLLFDLRSGRGAFISSTGIFGRELFNYTPQEPRNVSNFLIGIVGANQLDRNGFANGNWGTQYATLRDSYNFKKTVAAVAGLSDAQRKAALGFAQTIDALELLYLISTRDTIGIVVDVSEDPQVIVPFVSRDSAYKRILATLDEADANLAAGGTAFPFNLTSGFVNFNTPTSFRLFNRAITARAAAYYATSGGGAAAWARSLAANSASFANLAATTRAALDVGPFHPYGSAPDVNNPVNAATGVNLYAHPSILTDTPKKADGVALDNRYVAKVVAKADRAAPGGFGINSNLGPNVYTTIGSPIPIIRNEELILLRAEALLATGDKAGALALINSIRINSGGLAASTLTAASPDADILTELLLQKRYSLYLEGHRWIDMRRYGRLNQLPLDITTGQNAHFVAKVMPVPGAECLVRTTAAIAGPGCPALAQ